MEQYKRGKSIKKYMHKFFKKNNEKLNEEILTNSLALSENKNSRQKELFKQFWAKNQWAHKQFSIAVSKGWEVERKKGDEQNKEKEVIKLPDILPNKLFLDVIQWSVDKYGKDSLSPLFYKPENITAEDLNSANSIFDEYNRLHPEAKNMLASSLAGAAMSIENDASNNRLPQIINKDENFKKEIILAIDKVFYPNASKSKGADPRVVSYIEMEELFVHLGYLADTFGHPELNDYISTKVNVSYELLENINTVGGRTDYLKFIGKDQI